MARRILMSLLLAALAAPGRGQDELPTTGEPASKAGLAAEVSALKVAARKSYQNADLKAARKHLQALRELYRAEYAGNPSLQGTYQWSRRLAEVAHEFLRAGQFNESLAIMGEAADLDVPPRAGFDNGLASVAGGLHRHLAGLNAEERYALLRGWSMPTETRPTIRVLTSITPTAAPPPVFARALGELPGRDSFAVARIGPVRGLFCTTWELAKAADESGNLRQLTAEVTEHANVDVPNARFMLTIVKIVAANRRDESLREDLKQHGPKAGMPSDPRSSYADLVVAAACLTRPWLQATGEDFLKAESERAGTCDSPLLPFLRYAHATAIGGRYEEPTAALIGDSSLELWIPAGGHEGRPDACSPVGPIWLSHEVHILHLAGTGHDYLLFKYPLTGEFEFTCDAQGENRGGAEGGISYRGLGFGVSGDDGRLRVWDASVGNVTELPCPFVPDVQRTTFNRQSLKSTSDGVTFSVNRHPVWRDSSNDSASPWIGLRSFGNRDPVFRNMSIRGTPVIPREVNMARSDSLRGWLPAAMGEDDSGLPADEWSASDGVIAGRRLTGEQEVVLKSRLAYQRPLQNDESIGYEFRYEPGRVEVHPALGRLVFLIEPGGVRLHWLTHGEREWTGLPADNAVAEPLNRRGPKPLPLKPNDWNRVTVALSRDILTLSLNDAAIYVRKMEPEYGRTFGFYYDRSQTEARVRDVVLRGDWPERLTDRQLANLTAAAEPKLSPSKRRALGAIFDDRQVPGSVLSVREHAAAMTPLDRYTFLSDWVLPNDDHQTLRMVFDFTPTDPAPPVALAARQTGIATGGELVSPALDLVQCAKELNRLEELKLRVVRAPSDNDASSRAQASLLALVDIARGDYAAANDQIDTLEHLLLAAGRSEFTEQWPETLVISEGLRHPPIREAARDLVNYLAEELRYERVKGPVAWVRCIGGLDSQLKVPNPNHTAGEPEPAPAQGSLPGLTSWSPASRATAWSRGQGVANTRWRRSPGQIDHVSAHGDDYLYYHIPLRGNFEIECDIGGFGWRDTQVMVAGTWVAPLVDHVSYAIGGLRGEQPPIPLEPRLPDTGEWIRCRTIVRERLATTFFNGRRIHEQPLPQEHDPWLAIHAPYYGFGGARDIRITGMPRIPEQVCLSTCDDLAGWSPYFNESIGDEDSDWRYDGELNVGEIIGQRRSDLAGSGLESLLRYHRPMMEDGTIEYEFYYTEGETHVHPALDRRAFVLDPRGVRIHWVTDGPHDRTSLDPFNLCEEPANRRGPDVLPLIAGAWNRLRFDLSGNVIRLTLNDHLVYEGKLEPTNQRIFGLFHYADQTVARVRNIHWRGNWPRQLPAVAQQELAGVGADFLDSRLPELTAVFEHDFVRDGLPLYRFHVYDAGWEEHVEAKPDGLHMLRPGVLGNHRYVVSPRMHVHGDFDAIATFEQLVVAPNSRGKWGISLRSVLQDKNTTLCSIFRGMVRRPGERDQHIAVAEFTQWAPDNSSRSWYPGKTSEEAPYGKLRLARRGEVLYCFFAERDSPHFRHIHTETVGADSGRYDGIRLQADAESAVDEPGAARVIWKHLVVRAESITGLPKEPGEAPDASPP